MILFANNAKGKLAAGITDADTALTLELGQGALFPAPSAGEWFPVTLFKVSVGEEGLVESAHEVVKCTDRTGDTLTVERAFEGSANSYAAGDRAELRLTAAGLDTKAGQAVLPQITSGTPHTVTGTGFTVPITVTAFGAVDKDALRLAVDTRTTAGPGAWVRTSAISVTTLGAHDVQVTGLDIQTGYDYRAVALDDLNPEVEVLGELGTQTTENVFVAQPEITSPANNAIDQPEQPVIETDAFTVVNGSDTHAASQYRITRVSDSVVVHDSGEDAENLVSYVIPANVLDEGEISYTLEARHKGTELGWSDWSDPITITTAASFFDAEIGDALGGGYYAGKVISDDDGETYAIIVSDGGGDSVLTGATATMNWRTAQTAVAADCTVAPSFLADGKANHDAILAYVAAEGGVALADFPAFKWIEDNCNSISLNGHADWYLPSRDELEVCYRAFKPDTTANSDYCLNNAEYCGGTAHCSGLNPNSDPPGIKYDGDANAPVQTSITAFRTGQPQAFTALHYWVSSEAGSSHAWHPYFGNGHQNAGAKTSNCRVRAVRRIKL